MVFHQLSTKSAPQRHHIWKLSLSAETQNRSVACLWSEMVLRCVCVPELQHQNPCPGQFLLTVHIHYKFAAKVLLSPYTHCGLHIPLFLSVSFLLSSVTSLQALPVSSPVRSWHVNAILHVLQSPHLFSEKQEPLHCAATLLPPNKKHSQPSKTPRFAQPVVTFAVLSHPSARPLAYTLSVTTRH